MLELDLKRVVSRHGIIRGLTQLGREPRRERHKTIDLIIEYNDSTWECNQLATFPSSSLKNERAKLNFVGF